MKHENRIENQIFSFLCDLVARFEIAVIVCSERKATAILRTLIEELPGFSFPLDWSRVLSTASVSQFDWTPYHGKNVLLFDELVHHGKTLKTHKHDLLKQIPSDIRVITAAFAVWEHCEDEPDFAYYAAVDSETYTECWQQIVSMLQRNGSLLLDTEHVELTVRLQCGVRDFYDELSRAAEDGMTYSFVSGGRRTNLTINQPDLSPDDSCCVLIPRNTSDTVVRKIRVLERTHDEFSIIPIYYPDVHCCASDHLPERLPSFLTSQNVSISHPEDENECRRLFYIVGLLGGIELLRAGVSALHDLVRDQRVILQVPKDKFQHLRAMYPTVDIDGLFDYVFSTVGSSKRSKPRRSRGSTTARSVPEEKLLELCGGVLAGLVDSIEENQLLQVSPRGKEWCDLMALANTVNAQVGLDASCLPVVADRLIDAGLIVTKVERITRSGREPYAVRTFLPEGEIVSGYIHQQQMVGGPVCLTATSIA